MVPHEGTGPFLAWPQTEGAPLAPGRLRSQQMPLCQPRCRERSDVERPPRKQGEAGRRTGCGEMQRLAPATADSVVE